MITFELTVFRQSRILLCLFLLPLLILIAIAISVQTDSFVLAVLFLICSIVLMYYFSLGNLEIEIENDDLLTFKWKPKYFFNYKKISSIRIPDIKTIVLDNDEFLRKIKTDSTTIYINNSKIKPKDANEFISKLKNIVENQDSKTIDSWDEWLEKGYIKTAYRINFIVLALSILAVAIFSLFKGFKPASLALLILVIPQIILYHKQMENKLKK